MKGKRVKIINGMFAGKTGTVLQYTTLKVNAVSIRLDGSGVIAVCYTWEVQEIET